LWHALVALSPRLLVYLMSFLTLGIFWVGQQTQFNNFARSSRDLAWIHLGFLCAVTLMPFSTALMAEFIAYRVALVEYWANILLLGVILFASWRHATRAGLLKPGLPEGLGRWMERRIVIAQALYAVGALLCVFSTYWSLGFIVVVQLNYAIAPRLGVLERL
ncbi:MAG TPA: TMEM175 family protein, partial [Acetobacteraceae bacterium]|nr:TMEM175 family protein [Acetobacteraceae bacterium]